MSEPALSHVVGPGWTDDVAAAVTRLMPASLAPVFNASFTRSHLLFDEFVFRLAVRVVAECGLTAAASTWATAGEAAGRAGLDPGRAATPVGWLLRHLSGRGLLDRDDTRDPPRFRAERPLPDLDPAAVLEEQRRHQPACLPSYVLAETAARDYPAFLHGRRSGEEILLAPARLSLWTSYFSNDNTLYAVNNRVGAAAVEAWMGGGPLSLLELGGGLASGAMAILEQLEAQGPATAIRSYRFTELVPAFLRRGQRRLEERFPNAPFLSFAALDMNRPFADQGVAEESVSIAYAVNTLHVAHDLAFTLGEIRRALEPGGQVIASECIRPWPGDTLYPEFIFNFLETFRSPRLEPTYRPNGGFLTPEQWMAALAAAGFTEVRFLPDVTRVREFFPTFYVGAFGATRPR